MATYNVQRSRGGLGVAVADAASPDTQTDLQLVGQNAVSYGLDVAQSFFFLLENFAKTTAPANKIEGQLWYDITAGALTLKVWNGETSTWDEMAPLELGSTEGALARWDDSTKTWLEDIRITADGSGLFNIIGPTPGAAGVSFQHNDTDLNIVGTGSTVDINITSGITAVNLPEITLTTPLAEIQGGTGTATYTEGDILFASGANTLVKLARGADGEVLTLASNVPTWASGGGLGTVTSTGSPLDNEVAVFTGGTELDSDSTFTWDGSTLNVTGAITATTFGGIAFADLIDRATPGTLAATTFSATVTFQGDLDLQDNNKILFGTGDDVAVDFDSGSGDFDIVAASAVDFNITGFSGGLRVDSTIYSGITGTGGEIKVLGTTDTSSTNVGFVSVNHNNDGQIQIEMGTRNGAAGGEINVRTGDLDLYATNTLVFNLNPTETTITAGAATAMNWHAVSGNDTTSSAGVFDDLGAERNVGYNETPLIVVGTSFTIAAIHIGKFLSRTASTSRVITLDATDDNIPIGGSFIVHNDHTTGTLTIATSDTLEWIDGSDSSPPTGTRTIAYNAIATVRKKSGSVWQIWGNGIS